jgi:hypothetical protein
MGHLRIEVERSAGVETEVILQVGIGALNNYSMSIKFYSSKNKTMCK